jgi:hypothetical protein
MDDLHFREIDLNSEPEIAKKFVGIVESELGGIRQLSTIKRSLDYDAGNAKVIGGFLAGELVSITAFMLMEFFLGNQTCRGYQAGFCASSKLHRGKGIWPRLIKFSEGYLSDLGASFIFGFPNEIAHPVWVKKLGYQSTELYSFRIFPLSILDRFNYNINGIENHVAHSETILEPNSAFNISWKKRSLGGGNLVTFTFGESVVWGVIRSRQRYSIKWDSFEVGGLSLGSASDLPKLLHVATKAVNAKCYYISLNRDNVYFPIFKFRKNTYHTPVIIKSLTSLFVPQKLKLNFFSGLSDVWLS